jgi:hypothetical protein
VRINIEVKPEELINIIQKLPNNKAAGLDRIPNKILKIALPPVIKEVAQAISHYLTSSIIPEYLKQSTTVVLQKLGKKDYSLPHSYRPITLENTLTKLIEKLLANRIADIVEEYRLLP